MLESLKAKGGKRWPRGQKFNLSLRGAAAEAAYREAVATARASGRAALDAAQQAWAAPFGVHAGDGVILGGRSIADVARALEDCGTTQADVKAAIDRLTDAGLVEPAAAPEAAAA
jgi:hypothetical protein